MDQWVMHARIHQALPHSTPMVVQISISMAMPTPLMIVKAMLVVLGLAASAVWTTIKMAGQTTMQRTSMATNSCSIGSKRKIPMAMAMGITMVQTVVGHRLIQTTTLVIYSHSILLSTQTLTAMVGVTTTVTRSPEMPAPGIGVPLGEIVTAVWTPITTVLPTPQTSVSSSNGTALWVPISGQQIQHNGQILMAMATVITPLNLRPTQINSQITLPPQKTTTAMVILIVGHRSITSQTRI